MARNNDAETPVRMPYDHTTVEAKWQQRWEKEGIHEVSLTHSQKPYYNLMMFPYPSAEGLHVGNVYAFTGTDIHGRFMAMNGHDVFEPMGFDAFGIHSENYAIQMGIHPKILTARNVERFRETQLKKIGNRFAWNHEVQTTWIFLKLFEHGLAERKQAPVNWCPGCKTVLADEQVIEGKCERSGHAVSQRDLEQWFFKITNYAQKLLDNLEWIDWSEIVKTAQRNWIGRSEGVEFSLGVDGHPTVEIPVYTTRPDTILGMTFVVLAIEHPLVDQITTSENRSSVNDYREDTRQRSEFERTSDNKDKTGVFTGAFAINPVNGERVPIWVADYVLATYGTGAIQAVPAHDERDFEFANRFGLEIREVVCPGELWGHDAALSFHPPLTKAYVDQGVMVSSGQWDGLYSPDFQSVIGDWFEQHGYGQRVVRYRLRDWLISRQRYWGPPIPIIYCPQCGVVPVPEKDLPVILPDVEDYMPSGTGSSPLAEINEFINVACPTCGAAAQRETDVSDNFLDSAWYFLRYPSSNVDQMAWDPELTAKWLPVDTYIGGPEHSVLHLLYTRFLCFALYDLGLLPFDEPFKRFRAHGIITKGGTKMSKSRGNVVNPDDYIDRYGADSLRLYLMFLGPYDQGGDFSDRGVSGISRFLSRIINLVERHMAERHMSDRSIGQAMPDQTVRELHRTIKLVTEHVRDLRYNTAISALMAFVNVLTKQSTIHDSEIEALLLMLAPFAPHFSDEYWERIGSRYSIHRHQWPSFDPELARPQKINIPVQVNGRTRDVLRVDTDIDEEKLMEIAIASTKIQRHVGQEEVKRLIYVPGKILNIVTQSKIKSRGIGQQEPS